MLFTTLITFLIISGSKNIEDIQSITKISIIINIINCIIFLIGLSILYNSAELEKSTEKINFYSNINDVIDNNEVIELNIINTSYKDIIGNIVKLDNLEVAQKDFPEKMNWKDAKIACELLGDSWRVPTIEELNILFVNRVDIGYYEDANYWSSTEIESGRAWFLNFKYGTKNFNEKSYIYHCRPVRSI